MKIGIYCCLIADILTKILQKCSLSGPLQNIPFLLLPLNLATKRQNLQKILKKNFSEAVWRIKLKLCRGVSNISLYKNIFCIAIAQAHFLLWQLTYTIDLQREK